MRRSETGGITMLIAAFLVAGAASAAGQVPQPFPGRPAPARPASPSPETATPAPQPPPAAAVAQADTPPSEASLGFPIYPNAQFIRSYDAGRGQRYYLFGSGDAFATIVKYYQSFLKTKGTLVFDTPATHVFEVGRFREETMAFPPGITIKDYTWNGSAGYPNVARDANPARFPSVIQIVPAPPGAPR